MTRLFATLAFGAAVVAVVGGTARAEDANAIVTHRQQVMNAVGAHMGSLACVAKMECQMEDKLVVRHAKGLTFMSSMTIPAFKEEGADATVKHTAKPEIWKDHAKFDTGLKAMATEAAKLEALATAGDIKGVGDQVAVLGKTCKGCHDDYRTK